MRLTKPESHKHNSTKFVRKFSLIPRLVQSHWIWLECYYIGYSWQINSVVEFSAALERAKEAHYSTNRGQLFNDWDFRDSGTFSRATHKWKKLGNKLPEDAEVLKWYRSNSALTKALNE